MILILMFKFALVLWNKANCSSVDMLCLADTFHTNKFFVLSFYGHLNENSPFLAIDPPANHIIILWGRSYDITPFNSWRQYDTFIYDF